MPDLSWVDVLARIALAGAPIVSAYGWQDFRFSGSGGVSFDPTRIAAQIVSGIGFLGAGAITRQGLSVRGLTTAATLWVVAAIGMAAGAGYYSAAVLGTALVLVSLWPLRVVARGLSSRIRPVHTRLIVEVSKGGSAAPVLTAREDAGAEAKSLEFDEEHGRRRVAIELELAQQASPTSVVARLMEQDEVLGAEWSE